MSHPIFLAKSWRKSILTIALATCVAGDLSARTPTGGAISGRATAGDTILIENPSDGTSLAITVDGQGNFRSSHLPIGRYTVTRRGVDGSTVSREITIKAGATASLDFADTKSGPAVAATDILHPGHALSISAEEIGRIPVASDITSVALLAPGAVRGDASFGHLPSFGGASVAENRYYINGLDITDLSDNLGFAEIPLEAIAEEKIQVGGLDASEGRALGGVVGLVTKRGANDFHAGGNVQYTPKSLAENRRDTYYANPLSGNYGRLQSDNSRDGGWSARGNLWASGAPIRDRLFAYGLLSYYRDDSDAFGSLFSTVNTKSSGKNPFWLLKADWRISDRHLLELTAFSSDSERRTDTYLNDAGSLERGSHLGQAISEGEGEHYVVLYTGRLTDAFTLTAMAGQNDNEIRRYVHPAGGPRGDVLSEHDENRQWRLGAEWQLGDHVLAFGHDREDYESSRGDLDQRAHYIEDSWAVNPSFMIKLGARWDSFVNKDALGRSFIRIDDEFSPRIGFSWAPFSDPSFKVFGTAGRYASASPPSVNTGTSLPGLGGAESADPRSIAASNLKPAHQDEYVLGFQKRLSDRFSLGVRGIFRDLKAAVDDNCDYAAILERHSGGIALPNPGFPYCRIFNPGEDAVFETDLSGNGDWVADTIPGARLSPEAKRTYSALELFFDGEWDKLFLQGSYTYAKSKGNTEGGVNSDLGQGVTNATQDFDYLELARDTYGYLPNDRRHSLKIFGSYRMTDEWSIGGNLLVQSGRPINCLGVLDLDQGAGYVPHPHGSSFMRCGTTAAGAIDDATVHARSRGTAGRLPWTRQMDINIAYRPKWAAGLTLKVDVFNITNSQTVTSVNEAAEIPSSGEPAPTYLLPTSFQAPRSVQFMAQYEF